MYVQAVSAFLFLPGIFAVLIPLIMAWIDPWSLGIWRPGFVIMFAGMVIVLWCVRDFFVSGRGTLAPWDPPQSLVVTGLYRHTRNPMYIGVVLLVLGWGLAFYSPILWVYTFVLCAAFHIRVIMNEEPWLAGQFGVQWEEYRQNVPRWLPRIKPWSGL